MEIKRENPASRQTRIAAFVRKNTVLLIALALAVLSIALVPPDEAYAGYYDLKTLCCLFGTLAVVCALKNIRFFSILAQRIIVLTGSERTAALALALTNQVLSATGHRVLPIESAELEQLVSTGLTIATALVSWWKNNSFTPEAIEADDFLCQLKEHK